MTLSVGTSFTLERQHAIKLSGLDKYLLLLRRELVRAQARLKRAEGERDKLADENRVLRKNLADRVPSSTTRVKPSGRR
jgi:hypothetical protein